MEDMKKHVESLIAKAANHQDYDAAMRFSQAALNAAHAIQVLASVPEKPEK